MCWLQPQILRHLTALRPERKIWSFSLVVWVIRNSDSTTIFLGVPKFWKSSCIVFLFRGLEILYPLFCFWESEILNPFLCCLGIRNSESSPVLFWGSEILTPLLCCLGDQKFWISCVVWGSEILNPLLCCFGGQKFWILSCVVWGIRNSESSPVLFGGSEILNLLCCLGVRNSGSSPVLIGGSLGDCLEEFYDSLQTGRRFLWVLTQFKVKSKLQKSSLELSGKHEIPWKLQVSLSANFTLISKGTLKPATLKNCSSRQVSILNGKGSLFWGDSQYLP